MSPTFEQHLAEAKREPAYWSTLASLDFIDSLLAEMDAQGVSGAELARRMGTSRAWVSRVLRGECNLTLASMGKLALALGMRVSTQLVPTGIPPSTPAAGANAIEADVVSAVPATRLRAAVDAARPVGIGGF